MSASSSVVQVYSSSLCMYCFRAKDLLQRRGISFTEILVDGDSEKRQEMMSRANGLRTVPQIFIGDRHVGGYDDLAAADVSGELEEWLFE